MVQPHSGPHLNFLLSFFGYRPSGMPRGKEETTIAWLWGVRAVMFILVAVAAFKAREMYLLVEKYPELQDQRYGEHILMGQFLPYISLIVTFPWLVISSALLIKFKGSWILFVGIIDTALAITTAVGVGMQAPYLPAVALKCKKGAALDWQVRGKDYDSLFVLASTLAGGSAEGKCKKWVGAYELDVASLFFQMVLAYIGVFYDEREHSILNPWRPFVNLILLFIFPPIFVREYIWPRSRFLWHYLARKIRRFRRPRDLTIEKPPAYVPQYAHMNPIDPKLWQVLTIEHVLLRIVDYMHYEDVINFSLTSRAVREAVFPSRDLEHRVPKLRKRCCENRINTKTGCIYCNKRICFLCWREKYMAALPGKRHIEACHPWCRKCYYQHFLVNSRTPKKPCNCTITNISLQYMHMCKSCGDKDPTELQIRRHKRYEQEAREIAFGKNLSPGESVKCGKCKKDLKKGMRFWICAKCEGECKDPIHPSYVGRQKAVDVEQGSEKEKVAEEREMGWWGKCTGIFKNR